MRMSYLKQTYGDAMLFLYTPRSPSISVRRYTAVPSLILLQRTAGW